MSSCSRSALRVAVHDADILHLIDARESGCTTARELDALLTRHAPPLVVGATGAPAGPPARSPSSWTANRGAPVVLAEQGGKCLADCDEPRAGPP
ncbi:hypothetical protein ACFWSF_32605 [Streptomyces sp. NPDC058611]|uniref:hypothetical protein n=1 Tax=unclassified Streptomyces TaxID=2593676 RepID=UPI003658B7D6